MGLASGPVVAVVGTRKFFYDGRRHRARANKKTCTPVDQYIYRGALRRGGRQRVPEPLRRRAVTALISRCAAADLRHREHAALHR